MKITCLILEKLQMMTKPMKNGFDFIQSLKSKTLRRVLMECDLTESLKQFSNITIQIGENKKWQN